MFGSNLPHRYKNWKSTRCHSRVVQFLPDAFGEAFFNVPECRKIRQLFMDASRGLRFSKQTQRSAHEILAKIFAVEAGPERLIHLLTLLDLLSDSTEKMAMASHDFLAPENNRQSERLQRILNHIDAHWQEKLPLADVAAVASLHPQSLSRYFRHHMRMTFQEYLIELRLSRAARELLDTDGTVSDIAYECGFNNLANFNRSFLNRYKVTPSAYRSK